MGVRRGEQWGALAFTWILKTCQIYAFLSKIRHFCAKNRHFLILAPPWKFVCGRPCVCVERLIFWLHWYKHLLQINGFTPVRAGFTVPKNYSHQYECACVWKTYHSHYFDKNSQYMHNASHQYQHATVFGKVVIGTNPIRAKSTQKVHKNTFI